MSCTEKHTRYQPTEAEFTCPKCKAKCGDFCVDESPNHDCELLHEDDMLICYGPGGKGCNWEGQTGKQFAAKLAKKNDLVPCFHCKGTGLVKKSKETT